MLWHPRTKFSGVLSLGSRCDRDLPSSMIFLYLSSSLGQALKMALTSFCLSRQDEKLVIYSNYTTSIDFESLFFLLLYTLNVRIF